MSRIYTGTTLGAPRLVHTMTAGAEAARQAVRDHRTKIKAEALVTKHAGKPEADQTLPLPSGAEKLLRVALALGYEARARHGYVTMNAGQSNEELAPAVLIGGIHRKKRVGFKATWVRGRAFTGLWYTGRAWPAEVVGVTEVGYRVGIERPRPKKEKTE